MERKYLQFYCLMFKPLALFVSIMLTTSAFNSFGRIVTRRFRSSMGMGMDSVPKGVMVDLINADCSISEVDLGATLASHKRCVIFAVPGAFTPTCSEKHLPGFIENSEKLKAAGVEKVYCLSVNDKFVMKSWAKHTDGCLASDIAMIADGNGDYTAALNMKLDVSGHRLGMRCKRFAAVVEDGKFTTFNVDDKGLQDSSAEAILAILGK